MQKEQRERMRMCTYACLHICMSACKYVCVCVCVCVYACMYVCYVCVYAERWIRRTYLVKQNDLCSICRCGRKVSSLTEIQRKERGRIYTVIASSVWSSCCFCRGRRRRRRRRRRKEKGGVCENYKSRLLQKVDSLFRVFTFVTVFGYLHFWPFPSIHLFYLALHCIVWVLGLSLSFILMIHAYFKVIL